MSDSKIQTLKITCMQSAIYSRLTGLEGKFAASREGTDVVFTATLIVPES